MDNNTSLALTNNIVGSVMTPADFKALDGLIQSLGDRSASLTPDEKTSAIAIVEEWNQSVVSRIQLNADCARDVLNFLNGQSVDGNTVYNMIEMFHDAMGDTPEYLAYQDAVAALGAVQADQPIEAPVTGDMTITEAERQRLDNRAAELAWQRDVQNAQYKLNRAAKAFITAINASPEVKSAKAALTSYRRKATSMTNECRDKATRAKLNISISDPETRKVLHDLMDFTKTV